MISFREFLMEGFLKAVGKMPDYKIILNAAGWFDKDVLETSDLAEIKTAIDTYVPVENPSIEEPLEESPEEISEEYQVEETQSGTEGEESYEESPEEISEEHQVEETQSGTEGEES